METVLTVLFIVGLILLVIYAIDKQIVLAGLEQDLSEYLANAKQVVEIADDPRVVIHYKAVVSSLSCIVSKYFPVTDLRE